MPQNQGPAGVKRPFGPRGAGNDQLSSAIAGALADASYRRSVCRHGETLGAGLSMEQAESASTLGNFIANEYSQQRTARTPEPSPAEKHPILGRLTRPALSSTVRATIFNLGS